MLRTTAPLIGALALIMKRPTLAFIAGALGLLGLTVASVPFVSSLSIGVKAVANRPHLPIENIKPNTYGIISGETSFYAGGAFLVYRPTTGDVRVWVLPVRNGVYGMPDLHWSRALFVCKNFGLDSITLTFRCLEPVDPSLHWCESECIWDLNGKRMGQYTDDMMAIEGDEGSKYFVVKGIRK